MVPLFFVTTQTVAQKSGQSAFSKTFNDVRKSFQSFDFDQTQALAGELLLKVETGEIKSNSHNELFFTQYLEAKANYWLGNLSKSKRLYQQMDTTGISPKFRIIFHCGAALNYWEQSDFEESTAHTLAARTIANQIDDSSLAVYEDFAKAILFSHLKDLDQCDFHFTRAADSSALTNKAILSYFKFRNQYHNNVLNIEEVNNFLSTYEGQLGYMEELFRLQIIRSLIDDESYLKARIQISKLNPELNAFSRIAFFKYYLLGKLELELGNDKESIKHFKSLITVEEAITPFKALRLHGSLAEAYDKTGQDSAALHHKALSAKFEAEEKESMESYTLIKNVLDFELKQGKQSATTLVAVPTSQNFIWVLLLLIPALIWVYSQSRARKSATHQKLEETPPKTDPQGFDDEQLKMSLSTTFPKLTKNDLAHAIFLIRRKSIKESAELLSVSDSAVMKGRSRLKKKLLLDENTDLKEFLTQHISS